MSGSRQLADYFADVLSPLGDIEVRRYFGGYGLVHDGRMFAVVMSQLHFRVDASLGAELLALGGEPFSYRARGKRVTVRKFVTPPPEDADDADALCAWSRRVLAEVR